MIANAEHMARLHESRQDDIGLCTAVEVKFIELAHLWKRERGTDLLAQIPESLKGEFKHWRIMRKRHQSGDYRHSVKELKCTRAIAQWTVDIKRELTNQPPIQLEWDDDREQGSSIIQH